MNDKKTLRHILMNILFYMITIFLVIYIVISAVAPEKMLDVFNFKISTVISESMEPTINKGDLIVVISTSENDIDEQDIIVFNNYLPTTNGGYAQAEVIHRYIDTGIDGDYITQGDNNDSVDTIRDSEGNVVTLTYEDVVGKYAFRIPFVGWLTIIFTQYLDPVFLGLIIVNVIIVIALVKYLKKKPEEETDEKNDMA